jgi:hypothetical protein
VADGDNDQRAVNAVLTASALTLAACLRVLADHPQVFVYDSYSNTAVDWRCWRWRWIRLWCNRRGRTAHRFLARSKDYLGRDFQGRGHASYQTLSRHLSAFLDIYHVFTVSDVVLS